MATTTSNTWASGITGGAIIGGVYALPSTINSGVQDGATYPSGTIKDGTSFSSIPSDTFEGSLVFVNGYGQIIGDSEEENGYVYINNDDIDPLPPPPPNPVVVIDVIPPDDDIDGLDNNQAAAGAVDTSNETNIYNFVAQYYDMMMEFFTNKFINKEATENTINNNLRL